MSEENSYASVVFRVELGGFLFSTTGVVYKNEKAAEFFCYKNTGCFCSEFRNFSSP